MSTTTASSNLNAEADRSSWIYVPIIVFSVICPILVSLRVWSRLRKGGKTGPDDWTILVSLAGSVASSGLMIASCQYGFGHHYLTLTTHQRLRSLEFFYLTQITYKVSINMTKASIILLYMRIFNKVKWFRWLCLFLLNCVVGFMIASVIATIFQCTPIRRSFDKSVPGTCINNAQFWYANAGYSIATDLVILFSPMWLVYKLQVPRVQKLALIIVFALGGFVVITSCLRITTIDITATTNDLTYDISSTMWTIIEMNVAIVCACLPMIRPLIVKLFPKLMPKSSSGNKYNAYGAGASFGNKSFNNTQRDKSEWIQIGGKDAPGIHMTSIKRAGSNTGSEESILATTLPIQHNVPNGDGKPGAGIQKTVHVSVEYDV